MLSLIREECHPCSGGWPLLCTKEWSVDGMPGVNVHLSYYRGLNAQPLACLAVRDYRDGYMNTPYSMSDSVMFDDSVPDDGTVRRWVGTVLDLHDR